MLLEIGRNEPEGGLCMELMTKLRSLNYVDRKERTVEAKSNKVNADVVKGIAKLHQDLTHVKITLEKTNRNIDAINALHK